MNLEGKYLIIKDKMSDDVFEVVVYPKM